MVKTFNDEQKAAILAPINCPVCLNACAGAGKTTVIIERYGELLNQGFLPEAILLLTFSKKAANELKIRLMNKYKYSKGNFPSIVSTFHGFAYFLLSFIDKKLNTKNIISELEKNKILVNICTDYKVESSTATIISFISWQKNSLLLPGNKLDYSVLDVDLPHELVNQIYSEYQATLKKVKKIDFDDLIILLYQKLKTDIDWQKSISNKYQYIIVDEFQDTCFAQHELLKLLASHLRLFVVGDSRQSIYLWRGARPDIILNFNKYWPSSLILTLSTNYRSSPDIIRTADMFINLGTISYVGKTIPFLSRSNEDIIEFNEFQNEVYEARFVCKKIIELITEKKYTPADIAILYRSNSQAYAIKEALNVLSLPQITQSKTIYNSYINQFLIFHLKLILNPFDKEALLFIGKHPYYNINATFILAGLDLAHKKGLLFMDIVNHPNAPDGMQKLYRILDALTDLNDPTPTKLLLTLKLLLSDVLSKRELPEIEKAILLSNQFENIEDLLIYIESENKKINNTSTTNGGINTMTIHGSKGLEFPIVFIIGISDGLFPCLNIVNNEKNINPLLSPYEEERRLGYVALTRAKIKLYLSTINMYLKKPFYDHIFFSEILESYKNIKY